MNYRKFSIKYTFYFFFIAFFFTFSCTEKKRSDLGDTSEIRLTFQKYIGNLINDIDLELNSKINSDFFQISFVHNVPKITANNVLSLYKGIYYFLEKNKLFSKQLNSFHTEKFNGWHPADEELHVATTQFRMFGGDETFDYCDHWNWDKWESTIEYAAMHGFNTFYCPLAYTQAMHNTWVKLGLQSPDLEEAIPGIFAGSLGRQGGITSRRASYMPSAYRKKHHDLQIKIAAKLKSLGMKMVIPAFNGYITDGYIKINPSVKYVNLLSMPKGAERIYRISWSDIAYSNIQNLYLTEIEKLYGDFTYCFFSPVNEQTAQTIRFGTKDLKSLGALIKKMLLNSGSDRVWIINSQPIHLNHLGNTPASLEALFSDILDQRVLLLEGISETESLFFYKAQMNTILNFGQRTRFLKDRVEHLKTGLDFYKESFAGHRTNPPNGIAWSNAPITNHFLESALIGDYGWGISYQDTLDLDKKYLDQFGELPDDVIQSLKFLSNYTFSKNNNFLDIFHHDHYYFQQKSTIDLAVSIIPTPTQTCKSSLNTLVQYYKLHSDHDLLKKEISFFLFQILSNQFDKNLAVLTNSLLIARGQEVNSLLEKLNANAKLLDYILTVYLEGEDIFSVQNDINKVLGKTAMCDDNIKKLNWFYAYLLPNISVGDSRGLRGGIISSYYLKRWRTYFQLYYKYNYLNFKKIDKLMVAWKDNWIKSNTEKSPIEPSENPTNTFLNCLQFIE